MGIESKCWSREEDERSALAGKWEILALFNILLFNDDNKMLPFTGSKGNATNVYLVANLDLVEKGD